MKHDLASEKLLELAYGELSAREARDVAAHAEGCERCREELARIRETRSLMAQLPMEPPPEGGLGIVMAAAREAASARGRRGTGLLPPWLWAGSLGAVAAVVVAVVSWQLTRTAPSDGLRARDGDLLGAPSPAVVAVAPPAAAPEPPSPAEPPVEQPKAVAS
jgi:anti-sigma factor RsiW